MEKIKLPNDRFKSYPMSGGIRDIVNMADKLEASGKKIYHLEIGRPDFESPKAAKEAAKRAIDEGFVHYADMRGVYELRETLARKLLRENSIAVSPNDVVVTIGAQAALTATLMATLNEGDEMIVPTPCFGAYPTCARIFGAEVVPAKCGMEDGFKLSSSSIAPLVTDRTKIIVLNSPNNPTGAVATRSELAAIAEIAIKNDLLVLSDECYEKFVYEGEHVSIGSLPGMGDRTVTIGSASKTYSMTGWRLGYIAAPSWMTPFVTRAHLAMNTSAATFSQYGYAAALDLSEEDVKNMIREYRERRDLVSGCLKTMKTIDFVTPSGAFYILFSIVKTGMDATRFCAHILEHAGVALVPGEAFEAPGFARMAYCKPKDYLREAMEKMSETLARL
jgi:aspartate aminotransferase/aminotransferase